MNVVTTAHYYPPPPPTLAFNDSVAVRMDMQVDCGRVYPGGGFRIRGGGGRGESINLSERKLENNKNLNIPQELRR